MACGRSIWARHSRKVLNRDIAQFKNLWQRKIANSVDGKVILPPAWTCINLGRSGSGVCDDLDSVVDFQRPAVLELACFLARKVYLAAVAVNNDLSRCERPEDGDDVLMASAVDAFHPGLEGTLVGETEAKADLDFRCGNNLANACGGLVDLVRIRSDALGHIEGYLWNLKWLKTNDFEETSECLK